METPANRQGGDGTSAQGTASTATTTATTASNITIDDSATRGLGPDASESAGGDRMARVRTEASRLKDQAMGKARTAAETGKEKASSTLDNLAQMAREMADRLEQEQGLQVANYARRAADAIGGFSQTLRERDVDALVDDAREMVRRSPAVAIGAAAAVGFALSRFLKASAHESESRMGSDMTSAGTGMSGTSRAGAGSASASVGTTGTAGALGTTGTSGTTGGTAFSA